MRLVPTHASLIDDMPMISFFQTIMSRRAFLQDLVLAGLLAGAGALWWRSRQPTLEHSEPILRALVETLLPADGGASDELARVATAGIMSVAFADPSMGDALRQGLPWFDQTAESRFGKSFAMLPSAQRDVLVAAAASARQGSVERGCFDRLRHLCIGFALGQPAALSGVAYGGPPLPAGYPDQADPPKIG